MENKWSTDPIPKPKLGKILVVRTEIEDSYKYSYCLPINTNSNSYWHNAIIGVFKENDSLLGTWGFKQHWQIAEFEI
jgi:hypothetical protein